MMTPHERYKRDPLFQRLVDSLEAMIEDAKMTGTEIREAAMLAAIHHEEKRPRMVFDPNSPYMREREPWRG